MKKTTIFPAAVLMTAAMAMTAFAAEYSDAWKQEADGRWYVAQEDGTKVTDAWVCDDAVAENGKEVWYLIGPDGYMLTGGLVSDGTGNYYSLETEHNGNYGALRYQSGTYDGIYLNLNKSHDGTFGKIMNSDGVDALKAKYGITDISGKGASSVYTSAMTAQKETTQSGGSSAESDSEAFDGSNPVRTWLQDGETLTYTTLDGSDTCVRLARNGRQLLYSAATPSTQLDITDMPGYMLDLKYGGEGAVKERYDHVYEDADELIEAMYELFEFYCRSRNWPAPIRDEDLAEEAKVNNDISTRAHPNDANISKKFNGGCMGAKNYWNPYDICQATTTDPTSRQRMQAGCRIGIGMGDEVYIAPTTGETWYAIGVYVDPA